MIFALVSYDQTYSISPPSRPLTQDALEGKLQGWKVGRDCGGWLSVDTVLLQCPGICEADLKQYMLLGLWKDALERGFFTHEEARKLHYVFIFDNTNEKHAQGSSSRTPNDLNNVKLCCALFYFINYPYLQTFHCLSR